jgi:pimeloyl-ACP methyl ester carboxylesterase
VKLLPRLQNTLRKPVKTQAAQALLQSNPAATKAAKVQAGKRLDDIQRTLGNLKNEQRRVALQELKATISAESKMSLQKGAETRMMFHDVPTGKGTAVLLHGWSAGTWQFDEMAPELYKRGYDVYIPRLPGHGFQTAAGIPDASFLPKAGESQRYREFADKVYDQAKRLGGPVHLVGLSGGATVALDLGNRHSDIARVVAMAPFLNIPNAAENVLPKVVDAIDTVGLGHRLSLLDHIPWSWGKGEVRTIGHHEFKLGNITSLRRYGMPVGERLYQSRVATQFITTAGDRSASTKPIAHLFKSGAPATTGWFEFPLSARVPHPMIAPPNNPDEASRRKIIAMVIDFLENGQPLGKGLS